jgi:hypothetical protein
MKKEDLTNIEKILTAAEDIGYEVEGISDLGGRYAVALKGVTKAFSCEKGGNIDFVIGKPPVKQTGIVDTVTKKSNSVWNSYNNLYQESPQDSQSTKSPQSTETSPLGQSRIIGQ